MGIRLDICDTITDMFLREIMTEVENGGTVYLREFATFSPKRKAAKAGQNFHGSRYHTQHQETMYIPERYVPSAKFGKQIKKLVSETLLLKVK